MKYSVNMISIDNITSPVILLIDGIEHEYKDGREVAADKFEKPYLVRSVCAQDGKIVIETGEKKLNDVKDPWGQENVEKRGEEPNVFDGT